MTTLAKLIVALGLNAEDYRKGLDNATDSSKSFVSKIGGFVGDGLKVGILATGAGIAGAIGGIFAGVSSNAEFERFETQFGVLLGSADAAQDRLQELADFGASTPFELPEVVKADKILQGFGLHSEQAAKDFGFAGTEIRTIAGDVAAGTGSSFEEMSLLLGKFSAGATGEAISRMAELGIASRKDLAAMGLEFSKSGELLSPLPESMNVVLQLMKDKYGGMMQAQSATFEGMVSNLMDWKDATLRTLSAPIFEVAKEKLGGLLQWLGSPEVKAGLESFAQSIAVGIGVAIDWITNTAIPAFQTAWINLQPVIATVGTFITDQLIPALSAIATWLQTNIPVAVATLLNTWNQIQPSLQMVVDFISKHADAILAGLAAVLLIVVVPAFIAWAAAAASAAIATIAALAPVLIPLALIGAAVALLYEAWNTNFLGIRDTLIGIWEGYLLPIFTEVWNWLQTNIPIAIQVVSDFWTNTLQPALQTVWAFIQDYVIPIFVEIVNVHIAALKTAIQTLANFWTTILWPALQKVWAFLQNYVIPIITAIINVHIAAFKLALRTLAAIWNQEVYPALQKAWAFIQTYVIPILTELYDVVIDKGLKPALQSVAFFILGTLIPQFMAIKSTISANLKPALETAKSTLGAVRDAFGWIDSAIQSTISWIQKVADKLNSIDVPGWLQGQSPPPMANWFSDIGKAASDSGININSFAKNLQEATPLAMEFEKAADRTSTALSRGMSEEAYRNRRQSRTLESLVGAIESQLAGRGDDRPNMNINIMREHDDDRTSRDEINAIGLLQNYRITPG